MIDVQVVSFTIGYNVPVVSNVGAQAATSLSHGNLLQKHLELAYLHISPSGLNHVLYAVLGLFYFIKPWIKNIC